MSHGGEELSARLKRRIGSERRALQLSERERDREREHGAHASRAPSCAGRPCPVSTVISQPRLALTHAGRGDISGSVAELGGDTVAICGAVQFREREQVP